MKARRRRLAILWGGSAIALASLIQPVVRVSGASFPESHAMGEHMAMTELKPAQPGDQARADAIVTGARKAADKYADYRDALADGYGIFMPNLPQKVYHFVKEDGESKAFNPAAPPALLYKKLPTKEGERPAYQLVGVMYMAPWRATDEQLNAMVPLSVAQWHAHTNLCVPPQGSRVNWIEGDKTFGIDGSITTPEACQSAGGRFMPHLAGWMVHVYPLEKDPARVWMPGMDEDHGGSHASMPGMKM